MGVVECEQQKQNPREVVRGNHFKTIPKFRREGRVGCEVGVVIAHLVTPWLNAIAEHSSQKPFHEFAARGYFKLVGSEARGLPAGSEGYKQNRDCHRPNLPCNLVAGLHLVETRQQSVEALRRAIPDGFCSTREERCRACVLRRFVVALVRGRSGRGTSCGSCSLRRE